MSDNYTNDVLSWLFKTGFSLLWAMVVCALITIPLAIVGVILLIIGLGSSVGNPLAIVGMVLLILIGLSWLCCLCVWCRASRSD